MNYSAYISELDRIALDVHLSQGEFVRSVNRSSAWWSQIKSGKRELSLSELHNVTESLGIEVTVTVNGKIDYHINQGDTQDYFSGMSKLTVHERNYSALWSEFSERNNLEDCELDLQSLKDYIGDIRKDGIQVPDWDNDTELLKRCYYRYLREFDGQSIHEVNGNRFPITSFKHYDEFIAIDWTLTGCYCGNKDEF
jgi:hypothetical protein